jgi:2,4-dienoyl-CoA reductase (NADPH2)
VDVLKGEAAVGERVAIIGMGGIGFDVALYLVGERASTLERPAFEAHWGVSEAPALPGGLAKPAPVQPRRRVTMMKRSTTPFGHSLGRTTGWVHRAELARHGVRMLKGVQYRGIDDAGVHLLVDGTQTIVEADTVVVCAGQVSRRELAGHHVIGGAREAGELDAKRAMREGAELGARL